MFLDKIYNPFSLVPFRSSYLTTSVRNVKVELLSVFVLVVFSSLLASVASDITSQFPSLLSVLA